LSWQPAECDEIQHNMREGDEKEKDLLSLTYVENLDDTVENYWLSVERRLT
jgi:hypothetical protein